MRVSVALLAIALWSAWRPAETAPDTGVLVAAGVLILLPWAWKRTSAGALGRAAGGVGLLLGCLVLSAATGPAAAAGLRSLALVGALLAVSWLASRATPPEPFPSLLGLGLSALAVWAVWQVAAGFERAIPLVQDLPLAFRGNALVRLREGRAFASLLLPGHLAVMLATAVPLLLAGLRSGRARLVWGTGLALCLVGLVLTRSPIGVALALAGAAAPLARRRATLALAGVTILAVTVLAVAVTQRTDVGRLEPVALRIDNLRTALWEWRSAPAAGVGLGGFGQVAQSVPFPVGNRPAHAHCLPAELLAELGPAGLAAFGLGAAWLTRLLLRLWPRYPEHAVALAIVPLHNLVDFSLYVSGVAVAWALLLGWGVARVEPPAVGSSDAPGRVLAVTGAALALLLAGLHGTSVVVERAAVSTERPADRGSEALVAWRLAPWRLPPAQLAAESALESGDPARCREAAHLLRRVRWLDRGSSVQAALEARLACADGAVLEAVAQARLAELRRPADGEHAAYLARLVAQLDATAHAAF